MQECSVRCHAGMGQEAMTTEEIMAACASASMPLPDPYHTSKTMWAAQSVYLIEKGRFAELDRLNLASEVCALHHKLQVREGMLLITCIFNSINKLVIGAAAWISAKLMEPEDAGPDIDVERVLARLSQFVQDPSNAAHACMHDLPCCAVQ